MKIKPTKKSLEYEKQIATILRDYVAAYGYFLRWQESGNDSDKQKAITYSNAWQSGWDNYITRLFSNIPRFQDSGMINTMNNVIEQLEKNK